MAGGFTDWANQKKITDHAQGRRQGQPHRVNYKKIIDGDEGAQDIILKSGDIVIIPN